jgi:hypothetical protein
MPSTTKRLSSRPHKRKVKSAPMPTNNPGRVNSIKPPPNPIGKMRRSAKKRSA